jgi:superfamily II DNA or RNA helicase
MTKELDFNLSHLTIKGSYSTSQDSMVDDFYSPCLANSVRYNRAVGYFSSAVFVLIHAALGQFVENHGQIRIICSPEMSNEDADAIKSGNANTQEIIEKSINSDLMDWNKTFESIAPSSLLRRLIESKIVDFRFAVPRAGKGIYHPKVGLFLDEMGNSISFNGSANETMRGWSDVGNHEYLDVFTSWTSYEASIRVENHRRLFEETWLGLTPGLKLYKPSELGQVFVPRENDLSLQECIDLVKSKMHKVGTFENLDLEVTSNLRKLGKHQEDVLDNWKDADHKGIISFVTGGGKTLAAIRAAKYWLDKGKQVIILVPSNILHSQWRDEIEIELKPFGYTPILVGNDSKKSIWKPALQGVFGKNIKPEAALFLSTYQTAKKPEFLLNIQNISNLLLIADEAHRLGAPDTKNIMESLQCPGRLALSATIKRYGDEEGTRALLEYFKKELEPKFDFTDAIKAGRLVPYEYEFVTAQLTENEEDEFVELTSKLAKSLDWSGGQARSTSLSQHFARLRANIVKQASNKDDVALKLLFEAKKNDRWLVYCNSIEHVNSISERLKEKGVYPMIYHSEMEGDRQSTLNYFEREGGILLSIKCLDEGVDIPKLDRALIIASSSNPREYIQRRGRALRVAKGKYKASIYDIIVTRLDGQPALLSDVSRAESLAKNANNLYAQTRLRELKNLWGIKNNPEIGETETFEDEISYFS